MIIILLILISDIFIIIFRSSKVGILLGINKYPFYADNRQEAIGQILTSTDITIHDDYGKVTHQRHLNNIALIKLPHAATLSEYVQPAKLITKQDFPLLDGAVASIVGWRHSSNTPLKLAKVRVRNQDTCKFMFDHYFAKQEFCVQWLCLDNLNLMGNPAIFQEKVFGFQTAALSCLWEDHDCTQNDLILSFAPYLDWISLQIYGNIEATAQINDQVNALLRLIEELKTKQAVDQALLNETFASLSKSIEDNRKKGSGLELRLNEELSDLKEEFTNNVSKQNASIYQLAEDFSNSRQEFSDGLSAQKASSDSLAKRLDALDARVPQLDENLKLLETQSEKTKASFQALALELQEEIRKVKRQVDQLQADLPCPSCVGQLRQEILDQLKEATTKVERQFAEIDKDLHHLHEDLNEVQSQEDLVTKKLWPQVEFLEKVVDETRSRLDKQIIIEHQHMQHAAQENEILTDTVNRCCRRYNGLYSSLQ